MHRAPQDPNFSPKAQFTQNTHNIIIFIMILFLFSNNFIEANYRSDQNYLREEFLHNDDR